MLSFFHCRAGLDKPGFCYIILLYGLYTAGKVCRRLHAALFLRGSPAFGPETVLKCAAGACAAGACAGRTAFLKQLQKIPLLLISCTQACFSPSSSSRQFPSRQLQQSLLIRALILFDCFGVIFVTIGLSSSRVG